MQTLPRAAPAKWFDDDNATLEIRVAAREKRRFASAVTAPHIIERKYDGVVLQREHSLYLHTIVPAI